jgi:hypothetical protein
MIRELSAYSVAVRAVVTELAATAFPNLPDDVGREVTSGESLSTLVTI